MNWSFFKSHPYSLEKSRHILHEADTWRRKKGNQLTTEQRHVLETNMIELETAILANDRATADRLARELKEFCNTHFHRSFFEYTKEIIIALVFALIVATLIRQTWFELYEIPTGSMRPTFLEQDHLTVSKLTFGINTPLETSHLYFDPNLVQRTSVLIFSGDGIPYIDSYTKYFWVFPYKKRYIKRLMGKPGDTLYFYGGKLYGFDQEGNPLTELLDSPWLERLDHVPFLKFEGNLSSPDATHIMFHQMNKALGQLVISPTLGTIQGEVFNGKNWIKDVPDAQSKKHETIKTYSDFYGMRNYGMAQLLTRDQLKALKLDTNGLDEGALYLEIRHNPSLNYPKPQFYRYGQGFGVFLNAFTTVIPLKQEHLDLLMDNMYTARFVVKDGKATRYSVEGGTERAATVAFPDVPNGTYEFYYGKAVSIGFGGIATELPINHPLYRRDPANIQKLYNLGMEMDTNFSPKVDQHYFPQRYTYFRDGDLYLLGAPILKKDDPILMKFLESENSREEKSTKTSPYVAFHDYGPPLLADGSLDKAFLSTFGFKIPDKHYLVLGDNHAMSSDSRVFGFIPEANIQGAPSLIIWPPSDRLGRPDQKPYPIITLPRMIVWGIVALIALIWYVLHRRSLRKPISISRERRE